MNKEGGNSNGADRTAHAGTLLWRNWGGRPFVRTLFTVTLSPPPAQPEPWEECCQWDMPILPILHNSIADFPRRCHSGWITKFRMKRFWFAKALKHLSLELEVAGKERRCMQLLHLWARCAGKLSVVSRANAPSIHRGLCHTLGVGAHECLI